MSRDMADIKSEISTICEQGLKNLLVPSGEETKNKNLQQIMGGIIEEVSLKVQFIIMVPNPVFNCLSVRKIRSILVKDEEDATDIFTEPPEANLGSDKGSGEADGSGKIDNLGPRQLHAGTEAVLTNKSRLAGEPETDCSHDEKPGNFISDETEKLQISNTVIRDWRRDDLQSDNALLPESDDNPKSREVIKDFLAIPILLGYNPLHSRRCYWDSGLDMRNEMVHSLPEQDLDYDESMIKYFGRHGCKQFLEGKLIKFGYKAWCLDTNMGYLVAFQVHQGTNAHRNEVYKKAFVKCAAPLVQIIDSLPRKGKNLPYRFYFDSLFTSPTLIVLLKQRSYAATATIRENRLPTECQLIPSKTMFKRNKREVSITRATRKVE
ncbi:piggyBac transposable element-derived protein 3-like [Schistocerca serialis cubense]|uniref:piggyBac transposable element-derived protein 3-like n=1 Tax=Schistocerca serialis cubense TaxID=2023355 RepID=UPI00214F5E9E|nr:piggyBac transposable element-derived protein 3-like [Schistocerca serialis cubense]